MRLVGVSGAASGRVIDVDRRLIVGRDEGCDLVLEDEKVSRSHCAFTPNPDGTVTVEDLGSSNGTFVGGERISTPIVLRGGEEVRIGSSVLRVEGERAAQATVVRAPATVVAAAPPPGDPATPSTSAGGASSWWRSRWALIGIAVAVLAIGGIVGGVLAVTGGGGDGEAPVAIVSTEQELETVTLTEAVETESPPETGGSGTGVVDTVQLSPEELALLEHVPESQRSTCVSYAEPAPDLQPGLVAGVSCPTADGVGVWFLQYDSDESMTAAYTSEFVNPSGTVDQGDCSVASPAEGRYSVNGEPAGRLRCFSGGDPVRPVIWFTTDGLGILSTVEWPDHSEQELYEWWASEPGLIP